MEADLSMAAMSSRQVRVVSAPMATLTKLLFEACGRSQGAPSLWPRMLRQALDSRDLALLAPLYGPAGPPYVPDCLVPLPQTATSTFDDQLQELGAVPADRLVAELEADQVLDTAWLAAARAPRRWLDAYLRALQRAWVAVRPLWAAAAPLVDREVERVGLAVVRGALDQVLDGVHPAGHVEDDRWFIDGIDGPAALAPDARFFPMVTGRQAWLLGIDDGYMSYDNSTGEFRSQGAFSLVAYPLPGTRRQTRWGVETLSNSASALDTLIGEPRAAILRSLDRPVTAGHLAGDLLLSPATVTHHVTALERTGLVTRERSGRYVLVHRSARGTALLHLYEA